MLALALFALVQHDGSARSALGRRSVVLGGVGVLALPSAQRALAAIPPPTGLDSSARYLPRGGPGGLPLLASKSRGVELLDEARAKLVELSTSMEQGAKLCSAESLDSVRVLVDKGASNITMDSGVDAYTVFNFKKIALRPVLMGSAAGCDEMQMRQYLQASVKAVDEIIKIGKSPTPKDKYAVPGGASGGA